METLDFWRITRLSNWLEEETKLLFRSNGNRLNH